MERSYDKINQVLLSHFLKMPSSFVSWSSTILNLWSAIVMIRNNFGQLCLPGVHCILHKWSYSHQRTAVFSNPEYFDSQGFDTVRKSMAGHGI